VHSVIQSVVAKGEVLSGGILEALSEGRARKLAVTDNPLIKREDTCFQEYAAVAIDQRIGRSPQFSLDPRDKAQECRRSGPPLATTDWITECTALTR